MRRGNLVVCAAAVALLAACGGGDKGSVVGGSGDTQAETSAAPPKPAKFADFPGETLVYVESGYKIGIKLKAIEAAWKTDVLSKPADPGKHYLQVWVVTTPELDDRGAQKISLSQQLYVRYKPGKGGCEPVGSTGYCYALGWPSSDLNRLLDGYDWHTMTWQQSEYTDTDFARGETRFGTVGFQVEDAVDATQFELCAPSKEEGYTSSKFPCIPIKKVDGSR